MSEKIEGLSGTYSTAATVEDAARLSKEKAAQGTGLRDGGLVVVDGEDTFNQAISAAAGLVGLQADEVAGFVIVVQDKDGNKMIGGNADSDVLADFLIAAAMSVDSAHVAEMLTGVALGSLLRYIDGDESDEG